MTGNKAPQPPPAQKRDGKGGFYSHILEIFDVDRRMGAQRAHRKVERRAGRAELGDDCRRLRLDIGGDADDIPLHQPARLFGDVRRRVAEPDEWLKIGVRLLGHQMARK